MAIEFGRVERVSRSSGGNACCKGAYNARIIIKDERTNVIYNFQSRVDNVFHEMLLPEHVDQKFKNTKVLMNAIEQSEKRKDSQLLKEYVLALPDEANISLEIKKEMIYEFIEESKFVKNGLAVQIDIHKPHEGDKNWHVHLLVTTRRFSEDGKNLLNKKAVDLEPQVRKGVSNLYVDCGVELKPGELWRVVQNRIYERHGLENRVAMVSTVPQEHIGPVRMRSILNQAAERNEQRRISHLENIKDADGVLDRITRTQSIFTRHDIERAVKEIDSVEVRAELINKALNSGRLVPLYNIANNYNGGNSYSGKENDSEGVGEGESKNDPRLEVLDLKTKYYTTIEVREEEQRVFRIADRVNTRSNHSNTELLSGYIKNIKKDVLSEVQEQALSSILVESGGVRILRGRAGTGKSHVLGLARLLSYRSGQQVIGLAPTHKAASELRSKGFEEAYTVKGFLFKLHNGKLTLSSNSLLIVDEAGMVGTSDYQELFKVAKTRNCNVILAGDERQLTSVERGGMFEVFANRFGSFELADIRRQSQKWSREMAICFANGDISGGVNLLQANKAIKHDDSLQISMVSLIEDYISSNYALDEKLAITVRNIEVDALNIGIREALKHKGVLRGVEYKVGTVTVGGKIMDANYTTGDRILFTTTNKVLGIENGEFATLLSVSKDKFIAKSDKGSEIIFNPAEVSNFKHGYAGTVYKAQGASIKGVYVLHSYVGNGRSSYVAMTRHIEEIKLYCNKEATSSLGALISQLSKINEKAASLNFLSHADIEEMSTRKHNSGFLNKVGNWVQDTTVSISDRFHYNSEYYKFEEQPISIASVEEVIEKTALDLEQRGVHTEASRSGLGLGVSEIKITGSQIAKTNSVKDNQTQENIRAGLDSNVVNDNERKNDRRAELTEEEPRNVAIGQEHSYGNKSNVSGNNSAYGHNYQDNYGSNKSVNSFEYRSEMDSLRRAIAPAAERIAFSLLGEPNRRLSNGRTLRYGESGKFIMQISGERSGIWHDFSESSGGDLIDLVQRERNYDFREAKDYLKSIVGMSGSNISYINQIAADEYYKKAISQDQKERNAEAAKIRKARELYDKAEAIVFTTPDSITKKYLVQHRGIEQVVSRYKLSRDLQATAMWDVKTKQHYPSLIAFARNNNGEITGGQSIYLDKDTAGKADILVNKRSFGKISGSFVEIQECSTRGQNITIIAEGVETALSLQEASLQGKIICSLGVSNIKNYAAREGDIVIIAADNDGIDASSFRAINKARRYLENQGAIVAIVMPPEKGDFNDVLKLQGADSIREQFEPELAKFIEDQVIKNRIEEIPASNHVIMEPVVSQFQHGNDVNIKAIEESLPKQPNIVSQIDSDVDVTFKVYKNRVDCIKALAPSYNLGALKHRMTMLDKSSRAGMLEDVSLNIFKEYVTPKIAEIKEEKKGAKSVNELIKVLEKEKEFCSTIYEQHTEIAQAFKRHENNNYIQLTYLTHKDNPGLSERLVRDTSYISKFNLWPQDKILTEINKANSPTFAASNIFNVCQNHALNQIAQDLRYLKEEGYIRQDGMKLENKELYLEYKMLDHVINPYLKEKYSFITHEPNKGENAELVNKLMTKNELFSNCLTNVLSRDKNKESSVALTSEATTREAVGIKSEEVAIVPVPKHLEEIAVLLQNTIDETGISHQGINREEVLKRAMTHYLEYNGSFLNKAKSEEHLTVIVKRAQFEEENYQKWKFYVKYSMSPNNQPESQKALHGKGNSASIMEVELAANRMVKMHSYLNYCGINSDNNKPSNYNNMKSNNSAMEQVRDHYHKGRDQKITATLRSEPKVIELNKTDKLAANYLATSIVDYHSSYDKDMLTEERLDIMSKVALEQSKLKNTMTLRFDEISKITKGTNKNMLTAEIQHMDQQKAIEFATHTLGHEISTNRLLHDIQHNQGGANQLHHTIDNHHDHLNNKDDHLLYQHHDNHINSTIKITRSLQQEQSRQIEQQRQMEQQRREQIMEKELSIGMSL